MGCVGFADYFRLFSGLETVIMDDEGALTQAKEAKQKLLDESYYEMCGIRSEDDDIDEDAITYDRNTLLPLANDGIDRDKTPDNSPISPIPDKKKKKLPETPPEKKKKKKNSQNPPQKKKKKKKKS